MSMRFLQLRFFWWQRMVAIFVLVALCFGPIASFAREPNDPYYNQQWYLEHVQAPEVWDVETGSRSITVAILDTGLALEHPDLAENLWRNQEEVPENGLDDDGNGYIDDVYGWDFVDNDNDANPDVLFSGDPDALSHGTVIAGILGAQGNNEEGISGVMWDVNVMAVRMLDEDGAGTSIDAIDAVNYAVENGADVINLSFSGTVDDPNFRQAIESAYEAGVVIVSALGNEGRNVDAEPVYPACYRSADNDWVIGVAAITQNDRKSTFSNYGERCTDLSAPGEDMFSLGYPESDRDADLYGGGWSGTSVASPLVAGAAGILLSAYPSLTPDEVRTSLKLAVDPLTAGPFQTQMGAGKLNIAQALEIAGTYAQEDVGVVEDGMIIVEVGTGISPVNGDDEMVDEVAVGEFITSPSYSTVYYVGADGKRHPFMDTQTFFTHVDSFDVVREVTDATLPELPLGAPVLPRSGVVLVKIQSDPQVYALEDGESMYAPVLRSIPDEATANTLYGDRWADYVIDVQSTFFARFATGEDMTGDETIDRSQMKTRAFLNSF